MDINKFLHEGSWIPGSPWFQPAHIMSASTGAHSQAPWTMQGYNNLPWLAVTVSAPALAKARPEYHTAQTITQSQVLGVGQAPTSGIYTGVEDVCNG